MLSPIFAVRGHGEFIHTRRPRKSDPRAGRTSVSCVSDRGRHSSVQRIPKRLGGFAKKLLARRIWLSRWWHRLGGTASFSRPQQPPFIRSHGALRRVLPGSTSATEADKKKPRRALRGYKSLRLIPITRPDSTKLAPLDSFVPYGTLQLCIEVPFRFDNTICGASQY